MRSTALVRGVAVAVGATAALALFATPANAGDPQPDLLISKTKHGGYVGQNQYDPPTPQTVTKKAEINRVKKAFVKVGADGTPGAVELEGPASEATLKLKYFFGGENVTSEITDANGLLVVVDLGESRRLRIEYKAKPGFSGGTVIVSGENGPNEDHVRLLLNAP